MNGQDKIQRQVLAIPDRQHVGLTTYDAKDPDTRYPPIERLLPPKGSNVLLFIDGQKVGEGRIEMIQPFCFSADERCDVGMEAGSPVSPEYGPRGNAFNGEINWVEIDADKEALDQDRILTGAERFRVAMALQ